jgi:hypothetical protein
MTDYPRSIGPEEKRKFWNQHFICWQESGLNQAEYCRQNNLSHHQWGYWKKRFVKTECTTEFVPLAMSQAFVGVASSSPIKLIVNEQYKIEVDRGFDPCTLKLLLTALQQL